MSAPRPMPRPTPETKHFWDGVQERKLILQACVACEEVYFPPQPFCPECASRNIRFHEASGEASLYSFVISHLPSDGFTPPYIIAVVELAEGPRMMASLVGIAPDPRALRLDLPLRATFAEGADGFLLPAFEAQS